MDIRVQELLEKIKKEGVENAQAASASILKETEAERARILAQASKEAAAIIQKAQAEAARFEESSKAALNQASRDLLLAFRGELEKTLATVVRTETAAAFDADAIQKALPAILEAWAKDGREDLSVLLPEATLKTVEASLREKLAAHLKRGVELKPHSGLKAGFRIAEKGGAAYYDFSADAVADMLGSYMNERLAAIVAQAAK